MVKMLSFFNNHAPPIDCHCLPVSKSDCVFHFIWVYNSPEIGASWHDCLSISISWMNIKACRTLV